jgi:hypothetical protein
MTTRNWKIILLVNLGTIFLTISPFLPGPPNKLVQIIFSVGQILGLLGLFVIPVGLIWTIKEFVLWNKTREHQISVKALLLLTLPITIFLTSIYASQVLLNFSRDFAINRADELVKAIEEFQVKNGSYPDSLGQLIPNHIPNIPSPLIMGIDRYYYLRTQDAYNIRFSQNTLMYFNFEIVTYDPTDNHKAEGELAAIYDTGKKHWKYYIFD